jgi:hypothetical protein
MMMMGLIRRRRRRRSKDNYKSSSLAAFFTASFFYANGILQAQGSPTNVCVEQDCGRLQLKVQSIDSKLTLKDSNHLSLWLDSNRL